MPWEALVASGSVHDLMSVWVASASWRTVVPEGPVWHVAQVGLAALRGALKLFAQIQYIYCKPSMLFVLM